MKLAPYPSYKPSGLEWLGDVPEHWEAKRLKMAATYWVSNVDKVPAEDEVPVRLCNYTNVYYHDHVKLDMGLMEATATLEEIRRFGLRVGDVVITKDSEDWRDIAIPALVVETAPDLVCGYHLAIIRPKESELLGSFLFRALQACAINQQFQVSATGVTRNGLPKSAIGEAWLPLPDVDEQRAIANFLDHETAKIATLVAKKRTLIERLKEKRTTLISRTVTHGLPPDDAAQVGLDPHPNLKPSGIDWLEDVPEHWEVNRLKWSANGTINGTWGDEPNGVDDLICVRVADFDREQLRVVEAPPTVRAIDPGQRKARLLRKGDLLMEKSGGGERQLVGCVVLFDHEFKAVCSNFVARVAIAPGHDPRYWTYTHAGLYAARLNYPAIKQTTGIQNLDAPAYLNTRVAFPPATEQRAIADFLDRETAKIDDLIAKVEAAIERLQEYRTALITATVTGKVDVRGAAV